MTRLSRLLVAALGLTVFGGCHGDPVAPASPDDSGKAFWALTLNHPAITLSTVAPYDTIQLVGTARDANGNPLGDATDVAFTWTDTVHATVTHEGLVRALAPVKGIMVIASLSRGNITHADTAVLDITNEPAPPALASFSIQPIPPEEAAIAVLPTNVAVLFTWYFNMPFSTTLPARVLDAGGDSISGLPMSFVSSDQSIAKVDRRSGVVTPVRDGRVTITASTTAYGVTMADTIPFTVTAPALAFVAAGDVRVPMEMVGTGLAPLGSAGAFFAPQEVVITAGGFVLWANSMIGPAVDVVFDDPDQASQVTEDDVFCHCGAGDVPAFAVDSSDLSVFSLARLRVRHFPVPGSYAYHSTLTHATGRIVVLSGAVVDE